MKKLITLLLIIISLSAKGDYWTQKASFFGLSTGNYSFSFAIAKKAYIGCGNDAFGSPQNDFWEWNQVSDTWTQLANFAGTPRSYAVSFAIAGKGYAGLGTDTVSPNHTPADFWEYNPLLNIWSLKAGFPGGGRTGLSVTFVLNNKGLICTGGTNFFYNDLWQYNPVTDTWLQKTSFPGQERIAAFSFSLGTKGYLGSGHSVSIPPYFQDFWEYDCLTDSWTQKANVPGIARTGASAFAIGNLGYAGMGLASLSAGLNDWWCYDATLNQWSQKNSFPGSVRNQTNYFSVNNKGYVCKGHSPVTLTYFQELWEYTPDSTTGIYDLKFTKYDFTLQPNPAKDFTVIDLTSARSGLSNLTITVTDALGKQIFSTRPTTSNIKLQTVNYLPGVYTVQITDGEKTAVKKFVKQ